MRFNVNVKKIMLYDATLIGRSCLLSISSSEGLRKQTEKRIWHQVTKLGSQNNKLFCFTFSGHFLLNEIMENAA